MLCIPLWCVAVCGFVRQELQIFTCRDVGAEWRARVDSPITPSSSIALLAGEGRRGLSLGEAFVGSTIAMLRSGMVAIRAVEVKPIAAC